MLPEHASDFREEVGEQLVCVLELIWPAFIGFRSVPMIVADRPRLRSSPFRHGMSVVEAENALAGRLVERERVPQPMGSLPTRRRADDLEFQPVSLLQPMNAAIEVEQEFQCMVQYPILW
ncbi:hypothetical protein HJG44_13690 [Enterovirga sp. DB1703]|uniref:Uncharacterized protein n=1 Tax=Enterovirga aerilata TaxID=2730920 RepID=A0A849IAZ9_9HYPH|nr:hypothetical protein [Enterovirga sp. DB1703]